MASPTTSFNVYTINQVDHEDMSESTHHTRFAEIALAGVQCQTEFKLILHRDF